MSDDYNPHVLFQHVKDALTEMSWRFGESAEGLNLCAGWSGANGYLPCFVQVDDERPIITFVSRVQCPAPEEKRPAMAEFVNRANCRVWVGHFEIDFADGEIVYRSVMNLADGALTIGMLAALVYGNVYTMDRYLPGIMGMLWNDLTAEDAVGLCEGESEEEVA
jgi:hypothetical protein